MKDATTDNNGSILNSFESGHWLLKSQMNNKEDEFLETEGYEEFDEDTHNYFTDKIYIDVGEPKGETYEKFLQDDKTLSKTHKYFNSPAIFRE